jgi:hypothetical protein
MAYNWNAPGRAKTEGVECQFAADIDAHTTAVLALQLTRTTAPILSLHLGLDALADAAFGEGH